MRQDCNSEWFLGGVVLLAALGPWLLQEVVNISNWKPEWVQAVSSLAAVAVAIYIPVKFEKNRNRREANKDIALEQAALKYIYHEVCRLKDLFMHVEALLEAGDIIRCKPIIEGDPSIDPLVEPKVEGDKLSLMTALGEYAPIYLGVQSRRVMLLNYLGAVERRCRESDGYGGSYYVIGKDGGFIRLAMQACEDGISLCSPIINKAEEVDANLSYRIKVK